MSSKVSDRRDIVKDLFQALVEEPLIRILLDLDRCSASQELLFCLEKLILTLLLRSTGRILLFSPFDVSPCFLSL